MGSPGIDFRTHVGPCVIVKNDVVNACSIDVLTWIA